MSLIKTMKKRPYGFIRYSKLGISATYNFTSFKGAKGLLAAGGYELEKESNDGIDDELEEVEE